MSFWERESFEKLLNTRGKDLVARIEEKEIDKQHKILQYVLTNRKGLFNTKGLKLDEMMREKKTRDFLKQETLNDLTEHGFDADEINVLFYLHQQKRLYDGSLVGKVREAGKKGIDNNKTALGIKTRIEPVEYKYTFNAEGELIDAEPHIPGQPYHGAKQLRWVDSNGKVHATAQPQFMHTQAGSGYVVKMESETRGDTRLKLNNPDDIEFADYKSFSADVMLGSESTADNFHVGLDYHTTIGGNSSWLAQIKLSEDSNWGKRYIAAFAKNNNTDYKFGEVLLMDISYDTWYKLRMDIITKNEDSTLNSDQCRLEFYVDGNFKISEAPLDSIDPEGTGFGPKRSFELYSSDSNPGKMAAFIDNVRAVYKNRIQ